MTMTRATVTTDFRTMPPGTYTVSTANTVSVIIVPGPVSNEPPESSDSVESTLYTLPTSTKSRVITVVETRVVTVSGTVADKPITPSSSGTAVLKSS